MRPFLIVWVGQAFSLLGSMLVHFAIIWWMTQTTGSATMLALATLARGARDRDPSLSSRNAGKGGQ